MLVFVRFGMIGQVGEMGGEKSKGNGMYFRLLQSSLLENLLDDLIFVGGAELVLKSCLGCGIEGTLGSVPV